MKTNIKKAVLVGAIVACIGGSSVVLAEKLSPNGTMLFGFIDTFLDNTTKVSPDKVSPEGKKHFKSNGAQNVIVENSGEVKILYGKYKMIDGEYTQIDTETRSFPNAEAFNEQYLINTHIYDMIYDYKKTFYDPMKNWLPGSEIRKQDYKILQNIFTEEAGINENKREVYTELAEIFQKLHNDEFGFRSK